MSKTAPVGVPKGPSIFVLFKPYMGAMVGLLVVVALANAVGLSIPRLAGLVIDALGRGQSIVGLLVWLGVVSAVISLLLVLQNVLTARLSEKVAFDLRTRLVKSLAMQPYSYVGKVSAGELVTRVTSDVDAVKSMVSQGIPHVVMAIVLLFGSMILLFTINVKLAFAALSLLPIIVFAFITIFRKAGAIFAASQQNLGVINRVISESILGAMLVRVLHSQQREEKKFEVVNAKSRDLGYEVVKLFSSLIPIVTLVSNIAVLVILWFGGTWTMRGDVTIGELSAFLSYYQLLIMPIFILGFISSMISRSQISYGRIMEIITAGETEARTVHGTVQKTLRGKIECRNVTLVYGAKTVLKDVSFVIEPGTRTALLGPTGAGKTQILTLLAGLIRPTSGEILIDDVPVSEYDDQSLREQIGIVFQESIVFQATMKENIQFKSDISEAAVEKAIEVSSLQDVIAALPQGLETQVSERGGNLSGGQKQRLMLARALALEPRILLLDDFTARVDIKTERQIQQALRKEFPSLTLLSITQKIEPIQEYDKVIFLMEGEVLATGTHAELLKDSVDYAQMYASQQSTE